MATDEEIINSLKTDWKPTDYYNFSDLNRVERATVIIRDKIAELRGETIPLEVTNDSRTEKTIEFADSLNRIERNLNKLSESFWETDELIKFKTDWAYNASFDFNNANNYENNLVYMNEKIVANLADIPYCGQYTLTHEEGVL